MTGRAFPIIGEFRSSAKRCGSPGGRGVDFEEVENESRQLGRGRDEGRPGGAGGNEDEPAERCEDEAAGATGLWAAGEAGR